MRLSLDEIVFWQYGFVKINATIAFTWGLMLSWLPVQKSSRASWPRI